MKEVIERELRVTTIWDPYDEDQQESILSFDSEERRFTVRVTDEFDDNYASGTAVGLAELGKRFRASPDGVITVTSLEIL